LIRRAKKKSRRVDGKKFVCRAEFISS